MLAALISYKLVYYFTLPKMSLKQLSSKMVPQSRNFLLLIPDMNNLFRENKKPRIQSWPWFEIKHLLSLDTSWNSREESNQIFGKDLLCWQEKIAKLVLMTEWKWTKSNAREVRLKRKQNNSRRTSHRQTWKNLHWEKGYC